MHKSAKKVNIVLLTLLIMGTLFSAPRERRILIVYNELFNPDSILAVAEKDKGGLGGHEGFTPYYAAGLLLTAFTGDTALLNYTNLDLSKSFTIGPPAGTIHGHPILPSEIPSFATITRIDTTIVTYQDTAHVMDNQEDTLVRIDTYTFEDTLYDYHCQGDTKLGYDFILSLLRIGRAHIGTRGTVLQNSEPNHHYALEPQDQGIIENLKRSYLYNNIPDSLRNGKELNYWDVIFDLRTIYSSVEYIGQNVSIDAPATITLDNEDPLSDFSLYKEFLDSKGGLFLMGSVARYHNAQITSLINVFTTTENSLEYNDLSTGIKDFEDNWGGFEDGGSELYAEYPDNHSNFKKIYNDLTTTSMVINGAPNVFALKFSELKGGERLIVNTGTGGNKDLMHYWGASEIVGGHGQLMTTFNHQMFSNHYFSPDKESAMAMGMETTALSHMTKGTFATLQNMFVLLNQSRQAKLEKEFIPKSGIIGDEGDFYITLHNTGTVKIDDFDIRDTVSGCLDILSVDHGGVAQGNIVSWDKSAIGTILPGDSVKVGVHFKSIHLPPCPTN